MSRMPADDWQAAEDELDLIGSMLDKAGIPDSVSGRSFTPSERVSEALCRLEAWWPYEPKYHKIRADARLIAAAPDMLAALHAALNWFTPPNDSRTAFPLKQITDAVNRATEN